MPEIEPDDSERPEKSMKQDSELDALQAASAKKHRRGANIGFRLGMKEPKGKDNKKPVNSDNSALTEPGPAIEACSNSRQTC